MPGRERRKFTPEYKAEVVALIRSSGKTVGQVSRDLGLTETSVREWVQKAEIEEGKRPGLTAAEREELVRLRRQVRVLEGGGSVRQFLLPVAKPGHRCTEPGPRRRQAIRRRVR